MRTGTNTNIASTHPVYIYQPSSSIMTNGPVPTGYVPVMTTNAPQNQYSAYVFLFSHAYLPITLLSLFSVYFCPIHHLIL